MLAKRAERDSKHVAARCAGRHAHGKRGHGTGKRGHGTRPPVALGLVVLAAACGCRPPAGDDGRPLAIVVSGDTAGRIVPCGCASNQYGGLPRRGTYVEGLRREGHVIVADVGGAPQGTSPYDRLKFEAILRGELAMGLAAHNVGAAEAALGPDYLRGLAERLGAPFVSANVRQSDGRPVAEPVRIVRAAGRRAALVGVLDPGCLPQGTSGVVVDPPAQSLLEALRAVAGQYDAVIVLAYMRQDALGELAALVPEVDAVVGGPTGQPLPPQHVGPTLVTSAAGDGKFLVRLDAPAGKAPARWTGSVVAMSEQYADDPEQLANLKQFYAELAERDFAADQTGRAERSAADLAGAPRAAGTARCRECHVEDGDAWQKSRHAHAWQSLVEKAAHVDPECQRCHSTLYGFPGGFASLGRSGAMAGVGCESCHGPSQAHAANAKVRTVYFARAKDRCIACHDRENSPQFEYAAYWSRVDHGRVIAVSSGGIPSSATSSEDRR